MLCAQHLVNDFRWEIRHLAESKPLNQLIWNCESIRLCTADIPKGVLKKWRLKNVDSHLPESLYWWAQGLERGFSCPARRLRLAARRVQTAEWTRWHRRRSRNFRFTAFKALCLMLGEYLDDIGLIIFYKSLPEASYNPIKLITKSTWYWLPRGDAPIGL